MKLILASNVLEHRGFCDFLRDVSARHHDAAFAVTGDLLNVFPEPGEDIQGSICSEIFGEIVETELDAIVKRRFKDLDRSPIVGPLKDMFYPMGQEFNKARTIAFHRYERLFQKIESALRFAQSMEPRFYYIPGNMDYPTEATRCLAKSSLIRQIDCEVVELNRVKIGALGGIPNVAHPFRGLVEISPYEMHENEYERRLSMLWGVDILMTHLSPSESPALERFVRESPLKLLICRAPFNFNRDFDFRGHLEVQTQHNKSVIMVRPFDYPKNAYYVVDINADHLNPVQVQRYEWLAETERSAIASDTRLTATI